MTKILPRSDIISQLRRRDGYSCQYPGCEVPFSDENPPTVDHWWPQSYGYAHGWPASKIWAMKNLKLMHKSCNAKKGDLLPNADGTLPDRPKREPRVDKSLRGEYCETCGSGRMLLFGEECGICGSGPQPASFPKYAQRKPKECSHGFGDSPEEHCWACVTGLVERRSAISVIIEGP